MIGSTRAPVAKAKAKAKTAAEIKAEKIAALKKAAKDQNRPKGNDWFYEDAAADDDDDDDDDDFKMMTGDDLKAPPPNAPAGGKFVVKNLIDFDDCDVPDEDEEAAELPRPTVSESALAKSAPDLSLVGSEDAEQG